MKLLLTPLLEEPHTRHRIQLRMKFIDEDSGVLTEDAALVTLEIFYLLKFEAQLEIIPCEAHLKHNTAQIGQMRPCVFITLNKQRKKTMIVDYGGIHPQWNEYAAKIRKT